MLFASVVAGCVSQESVRENELLELAQWLPGTYDNMAQVRADEQQGVRPPHDGLALAIVRVDAPVLGRKVFYMQEMAADDPHRVMSQRIVTFEVTDRGIVQTVWTLAEPARWRDGHLNPDLLKALVPGDVRAMQGCELIWKKTAGRYLGASDPHRCLQPSRSASSTQTEFRAQLGPADFATAELGYDSAGGLVQGRLDEPFDRFLKQAE
jgi:hypothetical protein